MKKILYFLLLVPSLVLGAPEDVVIIGGGPGGLTAALYLARAGLHPLIIHSDHHTSALAESPMVENWPGELSISGIDLLEKMKQQVVANGAILQAAEVVAVDFSKNPFQITVQDPFALNKEKKNLYAKACIIATGATANTLNVPGEKEYFLKGVHTCAVCDGTLYKNKEVAVVGGGDGAITEALYLANFAKKVTLLVRSCSLKTIENARKDKLLAMHNVEVHYDTIVQEIHGNAGVVDHLSLFSKGTQETSTLPVSALFLAIGSRPNTTLFQNQIELDSHGYIVTQDEVKTNIPLVYAVGDVADKKYRQAVTASSAGAKTAIELLEEPIINPSKTLTVQTKIIPPLDQFKVIAIKTSAQFQKEVLESECPVIVDFYADWCGPCKALEPHMQTWSEHFKGKIKFVKINIDQFNKLAQRYNVRAVPTVLYFDEHGSLASSSTGLQEIQKLMGGLE